ncbi:hypothetical protein A1OE_1109 [Candidatus Endolissoclinum faulkneri L2]|uniref:Uncharacterized protein n=1 Tax=Candidatus Endolissoclinum faulkneri L2 TaxID=1193729 RepID=K7YP26_9PROT|nr:hypothetical protein A1OE_1109 [Candidatus Endolissoclinum faulkneri L2]
MVNFVIAICVKYFFKLINKHIIKYILIIELPNHIKLM